MWPFSELPGFNFADMISIVMSRRFLEPLAGTPFWEEHQKVYRKVRGALGEKALKFCEQLNQTIRVSGFGVSDSTNRGKILDTILLAMEGKRRVLVSYQSQESTEPIEQELGPYPLQPFKPATDRVATVDSWRHREKWFAASKTATNGSADN